MSWGLGGTDLDYAARWDLLTRLLAGAGFDDDRFDDEPYRPIMGFDLAITYALVERDWIRGPSGCRVRSWRWDAEAGSAGNGAV